MNSNSDKEKNTVTIYQLLEELKSRFSVLEKEIKLDISPVQSELNVEMAIAEKPISGLEDKLK